MPPSPSILNRLVSARYLLEHSGPQLTKHSDSRAVAHAVLMAHDAAELALGALAEHKLAALAPRTTFPDLLKAVNEKLAPTGLPGLSDFNRLNGARVEFKHHGNLPDPGTWFTVTQLITDHLNQACKLVLGTALTEVDIAHLIQDHEIVELIAAAKRDNASGKYREALEKLGHALIKANLSLFPIPLQVMPGNPDPQLALLLTGYGVDPSSFIIMQQLLPSGTDSGVGWNRHDTGHAGNWNEGNVSFCVDTLVELLVRLQSAHPLPQPTKFYQSYRDVLTIAVDRPEVRKGQELPMAEPIKFSATPFELLTLGDKIYGRVSASADPDGHYNDRNADFDRAEWLKIEGPSYLKTTGSSSDRYVFHREEFLVVRREHVTISFELLDEHDFASVPLE